MSRNHRVITLWSEHSNVSDPPPPPVWDLRDSRRWWRSEKKCDSQLSCCESVIFGLSIIRSVEINLESRNLTTYFSRKDTFHPY